MASVTQSVIHSYDGAHDFATYCVKVGRIWTLALHTDSSSLIQHKSESDHGSYQVLRCVVQLDE
jgi:hypothetical protein